MNNIGIVGVGTMGFPIARHILSFGYNLYFYARKNDVIHELSSYGGKFIRDLCTIGNNIDVLILFVVNYEQCRKCLIEVCKNLKLGTIIVGSSLSPQEIIDLKNEFETEQIKILSAPVSGGEKGAIEGKLVSIVSGDEGGYAKVEHIIRTYSSKIFYLGPDVSSSQVVKLFNQLCVAVNNIAVCVNAYISKKNDIDLDMSMKIIESCSGNSNILQSRHKFIVDRDYSKRASVDILIKDIINLKKYCEAQGLNIEFIDIILNYYQQNSTMGYGDEDIIALIKSVGEKK